MSAIARRNPKGRLTHFIAIPLAKEQLEISLAQFRDAVLARYPDFPVKAIRPASTIHLTIAVMALGERGQMLAKAEETLRKLVAQVGPRERMVVGLKGLRTFSDANPRQAKVLYGAVAGADVPRLQAFANNALSYLVESGLPVQLKNDDRSVALHATVINTIYASPKTSPRQTRSSDHSDWNASARPPSSKPYGGDGFKANRPNKAARAEMRRVTIDATELLAEYAEFEFMKPLHLDRIGIYRMGERPEADGGGYECVASVELP